MRCLDVSIRIFVFRFCARRAQKRKTEKIGSTSDRRFYDARTNTIGAYAAGAYVAGPAAGASRHTDLLQRGAELHRRSLRRVLAPERRAADLWLPAQRRAPG